MSSLTSVPPEDAKRFMDLCRLLDNGCMLWTGEKADNGQCLFTLDGRKRYARRVAWIIDKGSIPYGNKLGVTCQNAECVNPAHMVIVPLDVIWNRKKKEFVPFFSTEEKLARYEASKEAAERRLKRRKRRNETQHKREQKQERPWLTGDYSSLQDDYPIPFIRVIKRR